VDVEDILLAYILAIIIASFKHMKKSYYFLCKRVLYCDFINLTMNWGIHCETKIPLLIKNGS